ncbi:hypothetical protein CEXT_348731 [Caerostris extrusa]|uniref:Uncharacterized protein n=1 Tax=Caerostris extrusa TaxID=172846 RepID=A0AAV4XPN4_CAEEX|nr:hypothetical protein CEXT_348731 [Caerostris extrusa]
MNDEGSIIPPPHPPRDAQLEDPDDLALHMIVQRKMEIDGVFCGYSERFRITSSSCERMYLRYISCVGSTERAFVCIYNRCAFVGGDSNT